MFFKKIISIFYLCVFLFTPKVTLGLAGFAELDYESYYTENIIVELNAPSDRCPSISDKSQTCFDVYAPGDVYHFEFFKGFELLTEINVPSDNNPKFILGKSYFDDDWFIYDINNDKIIFRDQNFNTVLVEWERLGNQKPLLANAKNFFKHFTETKESKARNKENEKVLWIIGVMWLAIFGIPIICALSIIGYIIWYIIRRIVKKRGKEYDKRHR